MGGRSRHGVNGVAPVCFSIMYFNADVKDGLGAKVTRLISNALNFLWENVGSYQQTAVLLP